MDVLDGVLHVGYIAKSNRRAILVRNDKLAILVRLEQLIGIINRPCIYRARDFSLRAVRIGRTQCRADGIEPYTQLVGRRRIDFGAHGRARAASDENLAHPINLRQFLRQHRVGSVIHAG